MEVAEKILVRRGNVVLEVNKDFADKYLDDGYDIINEFGGVITEGTPNDQYALNRAVERLTKENKELKATIQRLQKAIEQKSKPGPKKQ